MVDWVSREMLFKEDVLDLVFILDLWEVLDVLDNLGLLCLNGAKLVDSKDDEIENTEL